MDTAQGPSKEEWLCDLTKEQDMGGFEGKSVSLPLSSMHCDDDGDHLGDVTHPCGACL